MPSPKLSKKLEGKSNRAAWTYLGTLMPSRERRLRLGGVGTTAYSDAIDDLGTDSPSCVPYAGKRYARDHKIREAVKQRAAGKCEYCGEVGFERDDGTPYLECHHILALANDGADRMTNVIAICPGDHREAHFGKQRAEIEAKMGNNRGGEALRRGDRVLTALAWFALNEDRLGDKFTPAGAELSA
jgi:hypothetical protein